VEESVDRRVAVGSARARVRRGLLCAFALAGALAASPREASAQDEPPPTRTPRVALRYDLATDVTATAALAATLVTWGILVKPGLDAPSCVICDGDNGKVNAVDDFFRSSLKLPSGSPAGLISDIMAYGVAPATGIALAIVVPMADGRGNEAATDILLVVEASLTFAVVQQGISAAVPRERPEVHAEVGDARARVLTHHSSLESFPAGHNGSAFAIAAAGGTVATMRGYRLAPLVWIAGGALALATSYLRIAADRHYFSDVAVGAALGIGIGIAVPLLFHRPVNSEQRTAALRWLEGATLSTSEVAGGRIVGIGSTF
jgi:membrane-associated phospholipid phosphatase